MSVLTETYIGGAQERGKQGERKGDRKRGKGRQLESRRERLEVEWCEGVEEGKRKPGMSKAHISEAHDGVNMR